MSSLDTFSQIKGQVVDTTNNPVAYANVCLLSNDSAFISGVATDEQGKFSIDQTRPTDILRISCVGYQSLFEEVGTGRLQYVLSSDGINLNEVTLRGHKKTIKIQGTDIVADIAHSPLHYFWNSQ